MKKILKSYQGLGEDDSEELLLNGYQVQSWKIKRVLEMDVGDSCTIM